LAQTGDSREWELTCIRAGNSVWPEEYLFENSRPHIYCKAVHLAASTVVSWVLAFSSDLPRAPNDVFEAGKGPDGTGSQERLVAAICLLSSCSSTTKGNTNPSSPTKVSCYPRAFVLGSLIIKGTQMPQPLKGLSLHFGGFMGRVGWGGA